MLYWLWSAFNLTAIIGLLYIFYRAMQQLRQHIGPGTAVLFVAGLLLLGGSRPPAPATLSNNLLGDGLQFTGLRNGMSQTNLPLEGGTRLNIRGDYYATADAFEPRHLSAQVSGMVLGHQWKPSGGLMWEEGDQLHYQVGLGHEWQLLGATIYTQSSKIFEGTMPLTRH